MKEPIVALEMAEQEFERFTELMDLDVDTTFMDEDDLKGFEAQKRKIVGALMNGSLAINDNGEPVFTPQRTKDVEAFTFYEPTGATLMAMDRKKKNEDIGKMNACIASMTKQHANVISKLKGSDYKIVTAIAVLFLG